MCFPPPTSKFWVLGFGKGGGVFSCLKIKNKKTLFKVKLRLRGGGLGGRGGGLIPPKYKTSTILTHLRHISRAFFFKLSSPFKFFLFFFSSHKNFHKFQFLSPFSLLISLSPPPPPPPPRFPLSGFLSPLLRPAFPSGNPFFTFVKERSPCFFLDGVGRDS